MALTNPTDVPTVHWTRITCHLKKDVLKGLVDKETIQHYTQICALYYHCFCSLLHSKQKHFKVCLTFA
jgi:hypothetical protein